MSERTSPDAEPIRLQPQDRAPGWLDWIEDIIADIRPADVREFAITVSAIVVILGLFLLLAVL